MKILVREILISCMVVFCPLFVTAQFAKIFPLNCDTLTFDTMKIPRLTYIWDGEFEDYELIDTLQCPRIIEVMYRDSTIRRRILIRENDAMWGAFFRNRSLWQVGFSFNCNGEKYVFSGDEYDMMVQTEKGKILAEFTKIPKHKQVLPPKKKWKYWRLHPRHGKPVKYARKLLRIYKSQYEEVFYHIENCNWH